MKNDNADYDFAKQNAGIEFAPTFDLEGIDDEYEQLSINANHAVKVSTRNLFKRWHEFLLFNRPPRHLLVRHDLRSLCLTHLTARSLRLSCCPGHDQEHHLNIMITMIVFIMIDLHFLFMTSLNVSPSEIMFTIETLLSWL